MSMDTLGCLRTGVRKTLGEIRFILKIKEWIKEKRKRNILKQKDISNNGMVIYQMILLSNIFKSCI